MTLQYTPVILPLLLSAATISGIALYAWLHRHERPSVTAFALLCLCGTLWALGDVLVWSSADLSWAYFWNSLRRLPASISPFVWFVFAAQYTAWGEWLNRRTL